MRPILTILFVLSMSPESDLRAQVYVVTTDAAEFTTNGNIVDKAAAGTEIYVSEKRGNQFLSIAPGTLMPAWISAGDVRQRSLTASRTQRVSELRDLLPAIIKRVNDETATESDYRETKSWMSETISLLGNIHPDSVKAIQYAALVARTTHHLSEARDLLSNALSFAQRVYGKDAAETAEIHLDLAYVLADFSELADAAKQAKAAALINSKLFGNDDPRTAEAFVPLAIAMESIQDDEAAMTFYRKVYASYHAAYGLQDERTLKIASRFADVAMRSNDKELATSVYDSVLGVLKASEKGNSRWASRIEMKLDLLKLNTNDSDEVSRFLSYTSSFKKQHPLDVAFAEEQERQLVAALLTQGRSDEALQILNTVLRRLRTQLRVDLWGLDETTQADYLRFADGGRFFEAIDVATELGNPETAIKLSSEWLLNGKGLIREVNAVRRGFEHDDERRQEWSAEPYVELEQLRAALPAGAIFIDILKLSRIQKSESAGKPAIDSEYIAWITPKSGPQKMIVLGDATTIESGIRKLRKRLLETAARINKDGEENAFAAILPELRSLSRLIWHPIAREIQGAAKIVLVPDAETWLAPWNAMLNEDNSFAIEKFLINLQVSGRQLVQADQQVSSSPAVIFAAPAYGAVNPNASSNVERSGNSTGRIQPVNPLESTVAEAAAARVGLKELTNADPEILIGDNARETRFKSLRSPTVVLLSTHGFSLKPAPFVDLDNPLLRCGLLLADANKHRDHTRLEDDGVLTGLEVVSTDLSGTQLAVLSACETAVGETMSVEGVSDLTSAFHLSGVRCVVSTLWPIHDTETSYLMSDFFGALANSPTAAEALRTAQIRRIQRHRDEYGAAHPFYWAAFIASGNVTSEQLKP